MRMELSQRLMKGKGETMSEFIIKKYNIRLTDDKKHLAADNTIGKHQSDAEYVKEHKDEIIQILLEKEAREEQAAKQYRQKLKAIEGLDELENCIADWSKYNRAMGRYIERDCTGNAPVKPPHTVNELSEKYPRAAAYIKADQWSYSAHYYKAMCGDKAKTAILNGENHKEVIEDMEAAWANYTEEVVFND